MRLAFLLCLAILSRAQTFDGISADSLRGNLSFLASDLLEGRGTPSRGLTVAAEFIASRFRAAGLETTLQTADFVTVTNRLDDFRITLYSGGEAIPLTRDDVIVRSLTALDLTKAPVNGPVKFVFRRGHRPAQSENWSAEATTPIIEIYSDKAVKATEVSLHLSAPQVEHAAVSNIVGLLMGTDPSQCIVVSAHYDHLGLGFDGANDNGSGVVSVIEIARALAALHPKRSILFAAFYGEEEGLLGSRYYVHHPLVPLRQTVANINLEQMGRTDEVDGKEVGAFAFTGPSYSNLPALMTAAARTQGVRIYNKKGADSFFDRSDNYSFAEVGIVAHTVVVAFEYPDYHAPGDTWEKLDYANMAKVDRAIAAGILRLADAPQPPAWSDSFRPAR